MKSLFIGICLTAVLSGCASNPVLTGKPQHWKGRSVAELKAALGEPTRVIAQAKGVEVWEYINGGDFVAPKEENTNFRVGGSGGGALFGAGGGISTVTHGERLSRFENVTRFEIRHGKVKRWYASRVVDGRVVWEDH